MIRCNYRSTGFSFLKALISKKSRPHDVIPNFVNFIHNSATKTWGSTNVRAQSRQKQTIAQNFNCLMSGFQAEWKISSTNSSEAVLEMARMEERILQYSNVWKTWTSCISKSMDDRVDEIPNKLFAERTRKSCLCQQNACFPRWSSLAPLV